MSSEKIPLSEDGNTQVLVEEDAKLKRPEKYQVILLNDDYTPMDFVVWLIQKVFHKSEEEATRLMFDIHTRGKAICGVFTYDIARTKVYQVQDLARKHEHPLECVMESMGEES